MKVCINREELEKKVKASKYGSKEGLYRAIEKEYGYDPETIKRQLYRESFTLMQLCIIAKALDCKIEELIIFSET